MQGTWHVARAKPSPEKFIQMIAFNPIFSPKLRPQQLDGKGEVRTFAAVSTNGSNAQIAYFAKSNGGPKLGICY